MTEQEFISNKIKEGFTKAQATMMVKMSFARENYAQQGKTFIDPKSGGGINPNLMTRHDSLDIQRYSMKANQDRLNRGFVLQSQEVGSYPEIHDLNLQKLQEIRDKQKKNIPTQVIQENGHRKADIYDPNIYQQNIDNNRYKNQETDIGVLDPRAAYLMFDRRATPTQKSVWMNPDTGDGATTYGYDFGEAYKPKPRVGAPIKRPPGYRPKSNLTALSRPIDNMPMQQGGINYAQQSQFPPFEQSLDGYVNYAPNYNLKKKQNFDINYQQNPQDGVNLDLSNYENMGNSDIYTDPEMQQRMAENKQYNTATNNYDERGNAINTSEERRTVYNNSRTNIINPYGGVGLEQSLDYFSQGFGEKDPYKIGVGGALSLLKGARTVGVGYSTGKENRRIDQEYDTRRFENPKKYEYSQMGGKVKNSNILAQNAIVDQGQGNINMEGGEIVQNPQGQIQPVYGSRHIENGKIAEGVNATLEDGSKILSDAKGLITLSAKDAKELKDRYNISVKKGDTPAQAQKKFDTKIGLKKEQDVLANYAEKMEKTLTIKDSKTKEVNLDFLQKSIAKTNTKIETLSELSKVVFDDLFDIQESKPKKGDGSQLYDSKGKEVTEVAQQGGMIKRADGSYSKPGLWDNIRKNKGSGKKPTKEMLEQERKINNNAQQGGNYGEILAQKYGISPERAQKLMQMGGESMQDEQEPQQQIGIEEQIAGALQNGAQPGEIMQQLAQQMPPEQAQQLIQDVMGNMQGEAPQGHQADPTQIIQAYAQIAQQDPQGIEQQLQQMQPQEQEQALQQMMSTIQEAQGQQDQGQDGEQNPAQEAQSMQREPAQQGTRVASKFENPELYKKQNPTTDKWATFGELLKQNPTEVLGEMKRLHPELYSKYFKDDKIPTYDKIRSFQEGINSKYEEIKKDYVKKYGADSPQVKSIDEAISKDKFLPMRDEYDNKQDRIVNKEIRGTDSFLGNYSSTRPNFSIEVLPKEDLAKVNKEGVNTASQLKNKFPDLYDKYVKSQGLESDFWLGEIIPTIEKATDKEIIKPIVKVNPKVEYINTTKNVMPQLPVNLRMFPSAMPALAKEQVNYGLLDPIKATPEAMLAEQERQRQTAQEQVQQSGLSAAQQEAVMAQGLVASQMASNDAIGKTQDFNNQNQFQTNQFNNQQRTRQSMSDANFNQDYQNKVLGSAAATERDIRNFYTEGNLQNRADYNSIENANLLNAKSDRYQYIPGQGVEFINNQKQDISTPMGVSPEQWKVMTVPERMAWMKADTERINNIKQMGGKKKAFFGY